MMIFYHWSPFLFIIVVNGGHAYLEFLVHSHSFLEQTVMLIWPLLISNVAGSSFWFSAHIGVGPKIRIFETDENWSWWLGHVFYIYFLECGLKELCTFVVVVYLKMKHRFCIKVRLVALRNDHTDEYIGMLSVLASQFVNKWFSTSGVLICHFSSCCFVHQAFDTTSNLWYKTCILGIY